MYQKSLTTAIPLWLYKRLRFICMSLMMLVAFSASAYDQPTQDANGNYEIQTPSNLAWFNVYAANTNPAANAILKADIDLSTLSGFSWTPIGTSAAPYTGTFDGGDKAITGFKLNATTKVAMFAYCTGTIKNLTLTGNVTSKDECAMLVNELGINGNIEDCTLNGTVTSTAGQSAASYCTASYSGKIMKCVSNVTVKGYFYAAGFVENNAGLITRCINNGTVTAENASAAGIAIICQSIISYCGNYATITGLDIAGGIGVTGSNGTLLSCFNNGKIVATKSDGSAKAGGIIGSSVSMKNITNCYYSTVTGILAGTTAVTKGVGDDNATFESNTYGSSTEDIQSGKLCRQLCSGNHTTNPPSDYNRTPRWGQKLNYEEYPMPFLETFYRPTYVDERVVLRVKADGTEYFGALSVKGATLKEVPYFFSGTTILQTWYEDEASGRKYTKGVFYFSDPYKDVELTIKDSIWQTAHQYMYGNDYYLLTNAGDVAWFAYFVNSDKKNAGACARLMNDIDMSNIRLSNMKWTPIADQSVYNPDNFEGFKGIFDGQGHTITNFATYNMSDNSLGFFGIVGSNGVVRHMTIQGYLTGKNNCGLIAGYSAGNIEDCVAKPLNSVPIGGNSNVGGIVGFAEYGVVKNCINYCDVTPYSPATTSNNFGGIAGKASCYEFHDCGNRGNIKGIGNVGGIIGSYENSQALSNCYSAGNIESTAASDGTKNVGAITGNSNSGTTITNCYYLNTLTMKAGGNEVTPIVATSNAQTVSTYSAKTADEFASGAVTRLLNGGGDNREKPTSNWGQLLGVDAYPVSLTSDNLNMVFKGHSYKGTSTPTADAYLNPPTESTDNTMTVLTDVGVENSVLPSNFITAENTAKSIVLIDKKDFYIPADVYADEVTYVRSCYRDGHHESICLPFAPSEVPTDYSLSEYYSNSYTKATFIAVEPNEYGQITWESGKAYLLKYTGEELSNTPQDITFHEYGAMLTMATTGTKLKGSYVTEQPANSYILGYYSDVNKEIFKETTSTYKALPFHAWLDMTGVASKGLELVFGDETPTGIKGTKVNGQSSTDIYYDLQSRRVDHPVKGEIYIINGKAIRY